MLKLYVRTGCPYCEAVLGKLDELEITFEELNVANADIEAELTEKGGKPQTPFLVDEARGVSMYESDAIMDYLDENYSPQPLPR